VHNPQLQMPSDLPISEIELRQALRRTLLTRTRSEGAKVCEEFALERGATRIDLAILADQLEGFELKSDRDSFTRLAEQMHTYNRVFDRITLVTGPLFEDAARALMPRWWGLVVGRRVGPAGITLGVVRRAQANPMQNAHSLAMLLWREEALGVLAMENARAPRAASRAVLHERLAATVSIARLRVHVLNCLHLRHDQSAAAANTR
jgi:hypothetical protein